VYGKVKGGAIRHLGKARAVLLGALAMLSREIDQFLE
jgi:hypothetical protein